MQITLNGELHMLAAPISIAALASSCGVKGPFAAELNGEIVPRARHDEVVVQNGDEVELVHFVGGG
jgi:thiamine biosynthesis protein ThiS